MKKTCHDLQVRFKKLLNVIFMTIPFAVYWYFISYSCEEVTQFCFRENLLVHMLFVVLYCVFGRIYEAFHISMKRISEMVYSQCLAALATDAIVYVLFWLLNRDLPALFPIFLTFLAQAAVAVAWSVLSHRWYYRVFPPKATAVIYDTRRGLDRLILEYGLAKKYDVKQKMYVDDCLENLEQLRDMDVVFLSGIHSKERNIILKYCMYNDIEVLVIPRIGDVIMNSARPIHMFHLPMLDIRRYHATPEYLFIKRMMDILISLTALILLSPIMIAVAIAIRSYDHGPAFYKQVRLTKDGKEFEIHKFRSMRVDAEKDGVARLSTGDNDDRITPIGKFIRKVRFDEIPQLLDILAGNLSIVGPRPERPEIAAQYCEEMPEFSLRLQAKAGLTGYAQVYGKYNTTPYDKLQMDLMYIAHPSIVEDIKIMLATVKILFMPESTEGVKEGQTTAACK